MKIKPKYLFFLFLPCSVEQRSDGDKGVPIPGFHRRIRVDRDTGHHRLRQAEAAERGLRKLRNKVSGVSLLLGRVNTSTPGSVAIYRM